MPDTLHVLNESELNAVSGGGGGPALIDVDVEKNDVSIVRDVDVDVKNTQVGINVLGVQRGGKQYA